ncbi:dephospho-CoA kinase [Maridesulfovibrio sp.]|uniref:dephospho-CoA kinase n=1 Tax=Maridesulfovibrio sp. TaxID=2795000 RepID=UPI002A18C226|nr:dephospho-CoA kinase [Maridesulfovibrio sp.]
MCDNEAFPENEELLEDETTQAWERTASAFDRNVRLDKFWGTALEEDGVSRGKVQDWIKSGGATVDGKVCTKANLKLSGGERLTLEGESASGTLIPEDKPLEILFNDGSIAVVNKPAGLTTHPAPSCPTDTLVHRLIHHFPQIVDMDPWRPGIVHRLDKFTSGLISVALNEHDRLAMSAAFADREVKKTYLAIVHGVPEREFGDIDEPIGRHPVHKTRMSVLMKGGREARSSYTVLWSDPAGRASLVRVRIHTGRTHQIRVHMAHIGHPLLGDQVYGAREHALMVRENPKLAEFAGRQMLHAHSLSFTHPGTGERLDFLLPPPDDFVTLLKELNRSVQRVGLIGMPCSGKSAVLREFWEQGIPVFSADVSVAQAYEKDAPGWELIRQRFGNRFIDAETGNIDKPALFSSMCEDESVRREIMDIIHPIVRHEAEEFFVENVSSPLAVAEVPLLLEGGWHTEKLVDVVVGVHCPESRRTGELREKRSLPAETLAVFDSWQWDEKSKLACCSAVIENDAGLDKLKSETMRVLGELAALREQKEDDFSALLHRLFSEKEG